MAVTAASAVNEEATSTHTEMGTGRIWRPSPSIADGSCNTGKPPVAWRPAGDTLPPLVAPAQNLRSRGGATRGENGQQIASKPRPRTADLWRGMKHSCPAAQLLSRCCRPRSRDEAD